MIDASAPVALLADVGPAGRWVEGVTLDARLARASGPKCQILAYQQ